MALVTIMLNGTEVQVEGGITILEAARRHGIEIPTLCDDAQLEPFASCWVCAVKLEGVKRFVPSCGTKVAPGMKVWTDTDDVRAVRTMALELLLSNHRGDCIAPCKARCPAGVDVQGYIALIAQGQYREATKLVKDVNPFPLAIGRVCPRPCEEECRRNAVDGAVGIDYLKRFAADWDIDHPDPYSPDTPESTGKKVALVGAGPGSLTAAYYLAQMGHQATVFEALPEAGGMLRYGIPEYRLPKAVLDQEIGLILGLGVRLECGRVMGRDFTLGDLFERGFDAVFLGLGAMGSRLMKVPGEDLAGVWAGTEFLKRVTLGEDVGIGKSVAIIGGGNTAIDASRTCVRLGAERVTIVYRRSRSEMPAWDVEVEAALHEGVEMHFLAAPVGIEGDGRCEKMTCIKMELGEPDASGRRRPVPIEGSEFEIPVDNIIAAIGQVPDLDAVHATVEEDPESLEARLELTRWGTIVADETTCLTSVPGVFAGGDVATGAATAIEAIAAGARAARAIDLHLRGEEIALPPVDFNIQKPRWDALPEDEFADVERKPRQEMPELPVRDRVKTFDEVELGLTAEQAHEEALRCLECGCASAFTCRLREYATEYGASSDRFGGDVVSEKPDDRHPFVRIEPEKCILCGRCIRICDDVEGAAALGFFRRGFNAQMKPSLDLPLAATPCEACGQCVTSCPTGALTARIEMAKPGPWNLAAARSTCFFCGTGCSVKLNAVGGELATVTPTPDGVNRGNLCVRGRFGTPHVTAGERLRDPLVREHGAARPAGLDEAVAALAEGVRAVIDRHGPEAVAVFGSPRLTNEEAYWLQKLARCGLGTWRVGSFGLLSERALFGELRRTLGYAASTASLDDLREAEVILVLDGDVAEEQTVAALTIRKAVRAGARLVVVSPQETRLTALADVWIQAERAHFDEVLSAMIDAVLQGGAPELPFDVRGLDALRADVARRGYTGVDVGSLDAAREAATAFAAASRSVLVASVTSFEAETAARDAHLAVALSVLSGHATSPASGALFLRSRANGQGVTDAGLDPAMLPGQFGLGDADALARYREACGSPAPAPSGDVGDARVAMGAGEIRAAIIVGEDPLAGARDRETMRAAIERLDFVAVVDAVPNETAAMANVVLPMNLPAETAGTFTNSGRRVQAVAPAGNGGGAGANLALLARIGSALGCDLGAPSPSEVADELTSVSRGRTFGGVDVRWGGDLYENGPATEDGAADLTPPDASGAPADFDPRWSDALEARFSRFVEEAGLLPHVVRRYGV